MRRQRRPYTPEEDAQIRAAMGPLLRPSSSIARQLCAQMPGRDENSILMRARYLRICQDYQMPTHRPGREAPKTCNRRCLRCGGSFSATAAFIRLCEPCKSSTAWMPGA